KVIIYMPDWMSSERINLMESYGAEVRLVSREQGGFLGSIALADKTAEGGGVFLPHQFSNIDNCAAHKESTGEEISSQLRTMGLTADGFVAGVGTGGTVMGVTRRLKKDNPRFVGYPLEPSNSPTLSTGYKVGIHRIAGISDEFIPDIVNLGELGDVISVDDGDAIIMARMLSEDLGLGVGISGGANLIGAVIANEKLGGGVVTTVFADDNKKYLSTDYRLKQNRSDGEYSKDIRLLGYRAIR
ncbi:MAG: pyridoxal-phosphate dependent enzyme, partial [Clostridia bacterium]